MLQQLSHKWMTSYRPNAMRTAISRTLWPCKSPTPLFVFGWQRAGTTMLADLLQLSREVRVYGEGDERYFEWAGRPKLKELPEVERMLSAERNRFVVIKPLCESQRADELMEHFPSAKGLWIYRHYSGCIRSHVSYYREYHNPREYVGELCNLAAPCWKNVGLSEEIKCIVSEVSQHEMNPETAYAIYWLARNSLYFSVAKHARISLLGYEPILAEPGEQVRSIFECLGIPFRSKYARLVASDVRKSAKLTEIDPTIAEHCEQLWIDLEWERRSEKPVGARVVSTT